MMMLAVNKEEEKEIKKGEERAQGV